MTAKENSISCDTCSTWWHLPCADLTMSTADALDSWVCKSCLADAANTIDSDDHDLEFTFAQESEETVTSMDMTHVFPVCSMKSIPVNGEHVCTLCKKQSMHGVVTMKTLQTLQISFAIIVFQINTIKDIELK